MSTINMPDKLDNKFISFAKSLELSKNDLIMKALESCILDLQEEEEDYQEVVKRLSHNSKTIPWEEVQRHCGLLED